MTMVEVSLLHRILSLYQNITATYVDNYQEQVRQSLYEMQENLASYERNGHKKIVSILREM